MVDAIKADDNKTARALLTAGLDPNTERGDRELQLSEDSRLLHWTARLNASKCAEVISSLLLFRHDQCIQILHEAMTSGFLCRLCWRAAATLTPPTQTK